MKDKNENSAPESSPTDPVGRPFLKLPIGIQNFKEIREEGYCYVDKTPHILSLIQTGKYYFLSRPRRFGKSLLVDTIRELFEGNEALFRGLYAYDRWDWHQAYPVLQISLGQGSAENRDMLKLRLSELLNWHGEKKNVSFNNTSIGGRFFELIEKTCHKSKQKVVILIDEYDKPILDNIARLDQAREIRDELRNFYSVIKDADRYVKFALITGVSKFSKVSLFSGLNNLKDVSLDERFATICGYTQADLNGTFKAFLSDVNLEKLRIWYNGYHFLGENVYNPFDVLLFLDNKKFRPYWFETAIPTFLIQLLEKKFFPIPRLSSLRVTDILLSDFDIDRIHLETLLFQTGYLTIASVRQMGGMTQYQLTYPNLEVKSSLNDVILNYLVSDIPSKSESQLALYDLLEANDIDGLKDLFHGFFASIPHDWYRKNQLAGYEGYYASVVYCYFAALGLDVTPEYHTNHGQIDLSVRFEGRVYLIEFKVAELTGDGSALEQIKAKKYHEKYTGKAVYLIGIEFSSKDRNIVGFEWEKV